MNEATPGEWEVDPRKLLRVRTKSDETVCTVGCSDNLRSQWHGNAYLISTAPDGLALAEMVLENDPDIGAPSLLRWIKIVEAARALIQKAEGK